ncbi:MAG TPA: aldo/keto reductase [Thermoleophilia bacterium]|nr:aldo/keto reductase [Thermoleophilia bacterium]
MTTLNNGVAVPVLGLGTYRTRPGRETRDAVRWALEDGYRHIDTARVYRNEVDVGAAVKDSGLRREDLFITTKLWNADQGFDKARRACERSLRDLDLEYVDLYLMHWPVTEKRLESWRAMESLLAEGACRAIGVSNFTVAHLEQLLEVASVVPAVNQVESSPFLYQRGLLDACRKSGIKVEAYSPLTRGRRLTDARLIAIAADHGKTTAQVLIRWALQHGLIAIPKSVHRRRIAENRDVFDFELSVEEMGRLDGLHEDLHVAWDPGDVP